MLILLSVGQTLDKVGNNGVQINFQMFFGLLDFLTDRKDDRLRDSLFFFWNNKDNALLQDISQKVEFILECHLFYDRVVLFKGLDKAVCV
jgi:hypothetical protein